MTLHQIHHSVQRRVHEIASTGGDWPCRRGCDDCCRHLAAVPLVSRAEWESIAAALDALPAETARLARRRIRDSASASRPVVCPLLDPASGACLIYEARPVACRAYGFYAERDYVLGCARIESISAESRETIWGNHQALEDDLRLLGPAAELWEWPVKASAPACA